jgi:hypothetical protein
MKRVRYVLGAAGLAPLAAAIAAPAAHAATAAPNSAGSAKVVSLHHTGMHRATLTAATVSSGAQSPGATAGGCTGDAKAYAAKDGHVKGQLWYRNNWDDSYTCIGTVDASLYYSHTDCKWVSVSAGIYSRPEGNYGRDWGPVRKTVCGTDGDWTVEPFGIHKSFNHADAGWSGMRVYISSQFKGATYAQFGS